VQNSNLPDTICFLSTAPFAVFSAHTIAEFPRDRNKPAGTRVSSTGLTEEEPMPVILLWGIPTLFVVVGGGYWLMHMHH
jgi:hypothetical protein